MAMGSSDCRCCMLALSLGYAGFVVRFCRVYLPDVPLRPTRPVRAEVTKLLNYGKYVLLANIGDKIVFATDAVVIGMFLPIAALTPYAIAGTLIESMRAVVKAMASVFNPLTSSLRASGQRDGAQPRLACLAPRARWSSDCRSASASSRSANPSCPVDG